jgi:hypothetical protein
MADPKTPFWKKGIPWGIKGVFTTKHPIPSTRTPNPLVVINKTVGGLTKKEWIAKQHVTLGQKFKGRLNITPGQMDQYFENAYKEEKGIHKRSTPKRQPVNYRTSGEKLVRTFKGKVLPKLTLAAKAIKIGKSLSPWGLGGTALLYAASKAYDPERVKKSKTKWGIK